MSSTTTMRITGKALALGGSATIALLTTLTLVAAAPMIVRGYFGLNASTSMGIAVAIWNGLDVITALIALGGIAAGGAGVAIYAIKKILASKVKEQAIKAIAA